MAMSTPSQSSAHQRTSSTGSIPYPIPGSPTLTNPDMILPDYPDYSDGAQSPTMIWRNANNVDMRQFDLGGSAYATNPAYASNPLTPTTPIIYGNGTMLSDIGEVTEAESQSSPAMAKNAVRSSVIRHDVPPSSEAMSVYETIQRKKQQEQRLVARDRQRRMSDDSTSTITNGEQPHLFADVDDTVSVDDSVFQGDDEESTAESYAYDDASIGGESAPPKAVRPSGTNAKEQELYASALSRRAEKILANAKRRLTTMEGNLSRARTSLSYGSGSTPSPPISRPIAAIHRGHDADLIGHNRISSENNIQSEVKRDAIWSPRSLSALGVAGGYRQPLQTSRSADHVRENAKDVGSDGSASNNSFSRSKSLDPLSEDEGQEQQNYSRSSSEETKFDAYKSPSYHSVDDGGVRRSASSAQMRDLKDHMNELKSRLSSLRDQTRVESLKRHSLQSLRTPSPFTHAKISQWYDKAQDDPIDEDVATKDGRDWNGEALEEDGSVKGRTQNLAPPEDDRISLSSSRYSNDEEVLPAAELSPRESRHSIDKVAPAPTSEAAEEFAEAEERRDLDDMTTEDGYEDDEQGVNEDGASDSGDSYYQDSVPYQVSHEDREDAFDYEHFFLHSAMGSMTQHRLRRKGSQGSVSSESSVETTRGPSVLIPNDLSRRQSYSSISTTDSFATALEGRSTRASRRASRIDMEEIPEQSDTMSERLRSPSPPNEKRATFGFDNANNEFSLDRTDLVAERRKSSATTPARRPSVSSSLGSAGTNRSFPLVNPPKSKNGIMTPTDSPEQGLQETYQTLMSETASIADRESTHEGDKAPMESLQREEQILVERLVASLGRCVLALTESGRASAENRMYKRRIDMARKILEGQEEST